MGRKAISVSKDTLKGKLIKYLIKQSGGSFNLNICNLQNDFPKLTTDLKKIQFDMENIIIEYEDFMQDDCVNLVGFQTLDNDLTYLGVISGGDSEYPLFYIIYFDGSTIRAYIPEAGNVYNKIFKTAYGSENESERDLDRDYFNEKDKDIIRNTFSNISKKEMEATLKMSIADSDEIIFGWADELEFNYDAIIEDIKKRIQII